MDAADTVGSFIEAWNSDGDAARLRLLARSCAVDAEFVSPQGVTRGVEALSAAIAAFRRSFPRAVVVHGRADEHNGFLRFRWETRWNDGRAPLFGDDFADLDESGRIRRLVSFDGRPAEPGA